ncbi:MAG: DUF885 domain-containing protein [Planctomycetota bacterium]|nr:MAG: DUF885 domain-containing protein [Planctomycetota bacterium]
MRLSTIRTAVGGLLLTALIPGTVTLPVQAAIPRSAEQVSADQSLTTFFRGYLEADFQLSPLRASRLGDHRFDHLLDDLSVESRAQRVDLVRQTLKQLPVEVNYTQLSREGQIDFEILQHRLSLDLWIDEHEKPYERDPRIVSGLATDCVYVLFTQSTLPLETNVTHALARMKQVPALVASGRASLKNPPRVLTETAIRQNRGAIAFYESELFSMVGETPQREALRAASQPIIEALKQHQVFLENELLSRATGDWRIGKVHFSEKLLMELDAGVTADEVLREAEANLLETHRAMLLVARQLWGRYFPDEPLPPDDEEGRRAAIRRVIEQIGRDHSQPNELARDAITTVADLKKFIADRDILALPEPDRCRIIEMPEFQRGNSVAFLDSAPPLDTSAASIYAISPPPKDWEPARSTSYLSEYNRQMLRILTIHEAYPGHYVQLEYANRHPSMIRRILGSGVYAEGWANYCEQMILDQGYGEADLPLRMMQLKFFLRSIANSILDHQMHCTEMTDDEALKLLVEDAFQGEGEARLKVIRSKQSSCQLSTYFVGRSAFMRLRRDVQRELGTNFQLGRFHEAILDLGTVPVKYMPELVRARLNSGR